MRIDKNDHSLDWLDASQVAAATECTGLIQGMPLDEEAAEAYTQLYPIPPPEPLYPDETNQQDLHGRRPRQEKPI